MITITTVHPWKDYTLSLEFSDKKSGVFDMKPYLETGIFQELRDEKKFQTARVNFGTVEWENGADFDPESLYEGSTMVSK
jgi:hypothetical protein